MSLTVKTFLREQSEKPFEVRELVRIKSERLLPGPSKSGKSSTAVLAAAKTQLKNAVRNDRLSVLCEHVPRAFRAEHVSPRNEIPENYLLRLVEKSGAICSVTLHHMVEDNWIKVPLPDGKKDTADRPTVDALVNIRRNLQNCVIVSTGSDCLYQTKFAKPHKGDRVGGDEVSIMFFRVNRTGDVVDVGQPLSLSQIGCSQTQILGHNQNQRLLQLEQHVAESSPEKLLFEPLRHFTGEQQPRRLLREIPVPAPETFSTLNEEQQLVAHPLSIRTAMECAGPPGTGKTKTITELMRSALYCTEFDVIILSERNGAIDAIADKLARDSMSKPLSKRATVKDFLLWNSVIAFGSNSMGSYTELFTMEKKLK
jgi:hypothetical protein